MGLPSHAPSVVATVALVLRRHDFSETSQTGMLLTPDLGRVRVLAKGIRRPNRALRGPMDLFALADVEIRRRSGDLDLLTLYRVRTGFPGLRARLEALYGAFYVAEILREGTREGLEASTLFALGVATLDALSEAAPPEVGPLLSWFVWLFLGSSGVRMDLRRCVGCGREPPDGRAVRVSVARGGILCTTCLGQQRARLVTLRGPARRFLFALAAAPSARAARSQRAPGDAPMEVRRLLDEGLEHLFERDLRSREFLLD